MPREKIKGKKKQKQNNDQDNDAKKDINPKWLSGDDFKQGYLDLRLINDLPLLFTGMKRHCTIH
jgi:hypothetical protein